MECTTAKIAIKETFDQVSDFSFKKRSEEEITNEFLDRILIIQNRMDSHTGFLDQLFERFEKISWFRNDEIDNETLKMLSDLLSVSKEMHHVLIREYIFLNNNFRKYSPKAIRKFKNSLDDIRESIDDIENIFFKLPQDINFQKANARIQGL